MKTKNLNKSMGQRIILLCIVLVTVCFSYSCKTIKQSTSSEIKAKTEANVELNQSSDAKLNLNQSSETSQSTANSLTTTDKGTKNETVEETSTTTKLSPPDSTGKQYPTETNTTKRNIKRGENRNLTAIAGSKSDVKAKDTSEDKSKLKANASLKDKGTTSTNSVNASNLSETIKTPVWLSLGVLFLLGILSYFVYRILKRYNLIK